ncbi:glycosyltransferase family 2 protein [bacterium]|nr:MAG: glycosyltransferase family 2 protein [bacterium]
MPKVSCIIPAYNEGPRIGKILEIVRNHPLIGELIVVDDCSKDGTRDTVGKFKEVKLIAHEANKGKSQAVVTGILASSGDFILLLDADLIGLTAQNVTDLIQPVLSGEADISISLRKNAPPYYRMIGLDIVSGERVFKKNFLENHLEEIKKLPRFGLESFMNKLIIKNNFRIKVVSWPGVESPWKHKKTGGLLAGIWGEIKMNLDIFRTVSPFGVLSQIAKMSRLKVK